MKEEIVIGGIYRHFKGQDKLYKVISVALDCENPLRNLVVYKQLYETEEFPKGTLWSRELSDFLGFKKVGNEEVKRFKFIGKK